MLLDDTRSACVCCEVDVGALGFDPLSSVKPCWAAASADVLTAVPVKGPLSHLLSMPVPAIQCNNQAEKQPFFPWPVSPLSMVYICIGISTQLVAHVTFNYRMPVKTMSSFYVI